MGYFLMGAHSFRFTMAVLKQPSTEGADMKEIWQVVFTQDAPTDAYGKAVTWFMLATKAYVPVLYCTSLEDGPGNLLRLRVLEPTNAPPLTLLVHPHHVLTALQFQKESGMGFFPPTSTSAGAPSLQAAEPPSPSGAGDTTDTA